MSTGARLTGQQVKAIEALLTHATIKDAAPVVGVNERTLRNWLRQPAFAREFREVRTELLDAAVSRLHKLLGEAVQTLERALTVGNAHAEVRAAIAIFANVIKAREQQDLAAELAELRAELEGLRNDESHNGYASPFAGRRASGGAAPT